VTQVSDSETERKRKNFTSGKFNVMNAIVFDDRLKPVDKLVAYVILQHMNSGTLKCWPSEQTIKDLMGGGVHVRTIQRSIARLIKTGWFSCAKRRGAVNHYTFLGRDSLAVHNELLAYGFSKDAATVGALDQWIGTHTSPSRPFEPPLDPGMKPRPQTAD
jgi:hypothetical protein